MTDQRSRPIELVRGGWGALLLLLARSVLAKLNGRPADERSVVVTRILGARQLTQAVLSGVRPSPEVLAMGIWVDVVHAMTAVGLAVADRSRIRAGLADATVAALWANAGDHDLTNAAATRPQHERLRDTLSRAVLTTVPGGRALLHRAEADRARHAGTPPRGRVAGARGRS